MARRGRSNRQSSRGSAAASANANRSRLLPPSYEIPARRVSRLAYSPISVPLSDMRVYHPDKKARPLRSRAGSPVVYAPKITRPRSWVPRVGNPANVMVCVRRGIRREVIMALGKGGKGAKQKRRIRRNNVRC